jgi:hypothetical protein
MSIDPKSAADMRTLSLVQAYTVCLHFYNELWPSIEPKLVEFDVDAASVHELFFLSICTGIECSALWIEAVFRVKKVPKKEQRKGLSLTVDETFLCTIEFCQVCKDLYKWDLGYTLNLLSSMLVNPEKHSLEWSIWRNEVNHVFTMTSYYDLDWTRELG